MSVFKCFSEFLSTCVEYVHEINKEKAIFSCSTCVAMSCILYVFIYSEYTAARTILSAINCLNNFDSNTKTGRKYFSTAVIPLLLHIF